MDKNLAIKIANNVHEDLLSFITSIDGVLYGITDFEEGKWTPDHDYAYKGGCYEEIYSTNVQRGRICSYTKEYEVKEKFNFILECHICKCSIFLEDNRYICKSYKIYEK